MYFDGLVESRRPRPDRQHREAVADDVQRRPIAPAGEEHRAGDENRFVAEQRNFCVRRRRQEERRRESAADRHQREALRALAIRKPRRQHRHARHQDERHRLADQMIEIERGVRRHVEDGDAAARHDLAVDPVACAHEAKPRANQNQADDRALDDPGRFARPNGCRSPASRSSSTPTMIATTPMYRSQRDPMRVSSASRASERVAAEPAASNDRGRRRCGSRRRADAVAAWPVDPIGGTRSATGPASTVTGGASSLASPALAASAPPASATIGASRCRAPPFERVSCGRSESADCRLHGCSSASRSETPRAAAARTRKAWYLPIGSPTSNIALTDCVPDFELQASDFGLQTSDFNARSSASWRTPRRSTFPVPSVGMDSTKWRSSRFGQPQARELGLAQPLPQFVGLDVRVGVERDESFAFRVVRDRRDDAGAVIADERLDLLLDLHVRHHLAGDLAEAREAIGDPHETGLVDRRDVPRDIPAVAEHLGASSPARRDSPACGSVPSRAAAPPARTTDPLPSQDRRSSPRRQAADVRPSRPACPR